MEETTTVLLVEDSATQLLQLQNLLEQHHYKVSLARSGEDALNTLRHTIPDIIISDILMPGIDGFEFCKQVKKDKNLKHIFIILLTSLSSYQDVIKSIENGANAFISKPYDQQSLLARLEYIKKNKEFRKSPFSDNHVEVFFNEQKHQLTTNHIQLVDLLLSTFENAVHKNLVLEETTFELLQTKQKLQQQNHELLKLNEEKNQFFGMVCHDLRNSLGVILSFSNFLLEHNLEHDLNRLDKTQQKFLDRIHNSSHFMMHLLDDILDISKIEAGKIDLKYEFTNLNALLQENVNINQILATKKNISLNFKCNESLPLIELDPLRFEQVLNNLISNAVKYSHPNTAIEIQILLEETTFLLTVKDEGQGIPSDELNKIFVPFGKTSVIPTQGEKSTGLGLAIVHKIVQEHQGEIWVESKPETGSTFFIRLPQKKPLKKSDDQNPSDVST